MAGEPAFRKVTDCLNQTLTAAAVGSVFIDKPEDEAFGRDQLPAINILTDGQVEFGAMDNGSTLHRATFDLDLIERSGGTSIDLRLAEIEADVIAALFADRTLGGLAQDVIPISISASGSMYAEAGARTLRLQILFLTPLGDHRTVIGTSGIFP